MREDSEETENTTVPSPRQPRHDPSCSPRPPIAGVARLTRDMIPRIRDVANPVMTHQREDRGIRSSPQHSYNDLPQSDGSATLAASGAQLEDELRDFEARRLAEQEATATNNAPLPAADSSHVSAEASTPSQMAVPVSTQVAISRLITMTLDIKCGTSADPQVFNVGSVPLNEVKTTRDLFVAIHGQIEELLEDENKTIARVYVKRLSGPANEGLMTDFIILPKASEPSPTWAHLLADLQSLHERSDNVEMLKLGAIVWTRGGFDMLPWPMA